jgi:mono/diheme cytochrome c family protein
MKYERGFMKTNYILFAAASLTLVTAHVACAADATKGGQLYAQRCAMCHGDKGAGDGPVAATIPEGMKPRNLSGGEYKYATDDAKFKELLQKGGAGVGLSPLMPAQSDLKPEDLDNIIAFVKSLKK